MGARLRFETLLAEISTALVGVDGNDVDTAVGHALEQTATWLEVDRGAVHTCAAGAPGIHIAWSRHGVDAAPSVLMQAQFPWTAAMLRDGGTVRFRRRQGLGQDAGVDRATHERLGTCSHVSIPLRAGGSTVGVLSFDSVRAERPWPDELVDRLRRLGAVVADAAERKRRDFALGEQLRFQRLLAELSVRLANVSVVDFDQAVNGILRSIGDFAGPDRSALIEFWPAGAAGRSWSVDDATDTSRFPWLMRRLQHADVVRVSDLDELPDDAAADRRSGVALGMKSLVALPLRTGGAVVGALVVTTVDPERSWPDALIEQLHLFSEAVAGALASVHAEREAAQLRQELAHIGRVSALGELTASLAHELNQPLTAILNNAEVAQHHLEAHAPNLDEVREILADIVADDKRASKVIQRLRTLLRKGTVEHVPLEISDVVGEVAQLVRKDVLLRNVPMTLDLGSGLPGVLGDRVQLQQVVLNMVLNGVEAMVDNNGRDRTLVIRTSRAADSNVSVAVEDSGAGVAARDLERIFQPLYTTKSEGLGMGLAIARSIIEAHGGELRAANNAGVGATFAFTLPAIGQAPR